MDDDDDDDVSANTYCFRLFTLLAVLIADSRIECWSCFLGLLDTDPTLALTKYTDYTSH